MQNTSYQLKDQQRPFLKPQIYKMVCNSPPLGYLTLHMIHIDVLECMEWQT